MSSRGISEPFGAIGERHGHVPLVSIGRFRHGVGHYPHVVKDFSIGLRKHWNFASNVAGDEA